MLRKTLAVICCSSLGACMSPPNVEQAGPPPENYRAMVAQHLRTSLFDPYSVRDAAISSPRVHNSISGAKWNVCFRGNAKNRLGGYTGMRQTLFVIENGRIIASDDTYGATTCAGASYQPFPELVQ